MSSAIEVVSLHPCDGDVRAFATIRLGGVTVHGTKIVQQPGQRAWVAMPDRQWLNDGSKKRWSPTVELNEGLRQRVTARVLAKWGAR